MDQNNPSAEKNALGMRELWLYSLIHFNELLGKSVGPKQVDLGLIVLLKLYSFYVRLRNVQSKMGSMH